MGRAAGAPNGLAPPAVFEHWAWVPLDPNLLNPGAMGS